MKTEASSDLFRLGIGGELKRGFQWLRRPSPNLGLIVHKAKSTLHLPSLAIA